MTDCQKFFGERVERTGSIFFQGMAIIGCLSLSLSVNAVPAYIPAGVTQTTAAVVESDFLINGALIVENMPDYVVTIDDVNIKVTNNGTIRGNPMTAMITASELPGFTLINAGEIIPDLEADTERLIDLVLTTYATIENSGYMYFNSVGLIDAVGANNLYVNNSGTLYGDYATTLHLYLANHSTVTNSGTIFAAYEAAIDLTQASSIVINNSGLINTVGNWALYGAYSDGIDIYNTGRLIAAQETVYLSESSSLVNSGLIQATNAGANAIIVSGNNTQITLNRGSEIIGPIVANCGVTGATLTMNHGAGVSYAYTTSGNWTLADLNNKPVVAGSAISAGIGAQETADKLLFQRTTRLNDSFATRLNGNDSKAYWVTPYAAHLSRESDDVTVEAAPFKARDLGVSFGKALDNPITVRGHAMDVDIVVNASSNHLDVDDESQTVRSSGVLAGLLAPSVMKYRGGIVSAKALVGYVKHRGDRTVITNTGSDLDVTADYHSLLAILGAEGRWTKALRGNLHGRFTAGLDVSTEAFAAYSESQYFNWNERTLTQLSGHLDAVVTQHIPGNKASIFGGLGVMSSAVFSGKTNNYQINQTNVSFSGGQMSDTYGRVQGGVNYQLSKTARMTANVDFTQSIHNISKLQGYVGVVVLS